MAIQLFRQSATADFIRIPKKWGFGEFQMGPVIPNILAVMAARAWEKGVITDLVTEASVWEFAARMGSGGSAGPWDLVGGYHGNVSKIDAVLLVDGVDRTATVGPVSFFGNTVVYIQLQSLLLPTNNAISIGTMQITHTFTRDRLLVEVVLTPNTGFEWYNNYTAMLPLALFNRIRFGFNATEVITFASTPTPKDLGSQVSTFLASSTVFPYGIQMSLPSGGPNSTGSWASSAPASAWWYDNSAPKLYVEDVNDQYATRITAMARRSSTTYEIDKFT